MRNKVHGRGNVLEYRLVLRTREIAPAAGALWSDSLDPLMHGGRGVGVAFSDHTKEGERGLPVLTELQIRSVDDYLRSQVLVRREIQKALREHRKAWRLENLGLGRAVWKKVFISCVLFETDDFEPSHNAPVVQPPSRAKRSISRPRSMFSVVLSMRIVSGSEARAWSDGHQRIGVFRDCRFIELLIEG